MMRLFSVLSLLLILSSCGYQWGQGQLISQYPTISVPYVEDDWDGHLSSAIIHSISQTGVLKYVPCGGSLRLLVKIVEVDDDDIGFRYDRTKSGRIRRSIIPDESRLTMSAEVTLVDASSTVLLGPARLTADVDFDHNYYSSRVGSNVFSLGQLTDVDDARDVAIYPLQEILAQKIVDFIKDSW